MRSGRALAAFALLLCCEWLRLGLDTVELGFATVSKIIRAPPVPRRGSFQSDYEGVSWHPRLALWQAA